MYNECTYCSQPRKEPKTRRKFVELSGRLLLLVALAFASIITAVLQSTTLARQSFSPDKSSPEHPEHPRLAVAALPDNRKEHPGAQVLATDDDIGEPLTAVKVLRNGVPHSAIIHKSYALRSCPHTIVTAYFPLPSKFSNDTYNEWMRTMLTIQDCMVVFTTSTMTEAIKGLRQHAMNETVIIEMDLQGVPISQLHAEQNRFWPTQLDMDHEKRLHKSHELFWIWLSKSWFVVQAIQQDHFHSNLYMWQDIGSFRKGMAKLYIAKRIIEHPEIVPVDAILWMAFTDPNPPPNPIQSKLTSNKNKQLFHSGSQAIGHKETWIDFHHRFMEVLDQFINESLFIGEDQTILQATCQTNPDLCAYVLYSDVVPDNNYFGLRYALRLGLDITKLWRMPAVNATIFGRVSS
jgi:hypothetical protein